MRRPLLEVADLDVRYGPSPALFGVSVDVVPGSVLAVLGVNGAGKSTFARAVSGLVAPSAGRATFDGRNITDLPAHRIRRLGLAYIPEGRGIFPGLSVKDDLRMAVAQEPRNARATAIERAIRRFPVPASAGRSVPGACPVVNSRCWPSPVPSPSRRADPRRRAVTRPRIDRDGVGVPQPRRGPELRDHRRAQ